MFENVIYVCVLYRTIKMYKQITSNQLLFIFKIPVLLYLWSRAIVGVKIKQKVGNSRFCNYK